MRPLPAVVAVALAIGTGSAVAAEPVPRLSLVVDRPEDSAEAAALAAGLVWDLRRIDGLDSLAPLAHRRAPSGPAATHTLTVQLLPEGAGWQATAALEPAGGRTRARAEVSAEDAVQAQGRLVDLLGEVLPVLDLVVDADRLRAHDTTSSEALVALGEGVLAAEAAKALAGQWGNFEARAARLHEAGAALERATDIDPTWALAWWHRTATDRRAGADRDVVRADLERLLALDPGGPEAHVLAADLILRRADDAEGRARGVSHAEQAVAAAPAVGVIVEAAADALTRAADDLTAPHRMRREERPSRTGAGLALREQAAALHLRRGAPLDAAEALEDAAEDLLRLADDPRAEDTVLRAEALARRGGELGASWLREERCERARARLGRGAGWTSLHAAVATGDADAVDHLLADGADLEAADAGGRRPLHVAAATGNRALLRRLLAADAELAPWDCHARTPLHHAVTHGQAAAVRLLLRAGADPTEVSGEPPLHLAAALGHDDVVKLLLRAVPGPVTGTTATEDDPDDDPVGETALHRAAEQGRVAVVTRLIRAGWPVDRLHSEGEGETALHRAARQGHVDVVGVLLDAGADPELPGDEGRTALLIAAAAGQTAVVEHLLDRGAQAAARDKDDRGALELAEAGDHAGTVALLADRLDLDLPALIRLGWTDRALAMLREQPALVHETDERGWTPLHHAAATQRVALVGALIEAGAEVDARGDKVPPAYRLSFRYQGDETILRMLADAGATIDWGWVQCERTCCRCAVSNPRPRSIQADFLALAGLHAPSAEVATTARNQLQAGHWEAAARELSEAAVLLDARPTSPATRRRLALNLARAEARSGAHEAALARLAPLRPDLEAAVAALSGEEEDGGETPRLELASALETTAIAHLDRGRLSEAASLLRRVLALRAPVVARAGGLRLWRDDDEIAEADVHARLLLAEAEAGLGQLRSAVDAYEALCGPTWSDAPPEPPSALLWGPAPSDEEPPTEDSGLDQPVRVVAVRDTLADTPGLQAACVGSLGLLHQVLGDDVRGPLLQDFALSLHRQVEPPDPEQVVALRNNLAEHHTAAGRLEEARAMLDAAVPLLASLPADSPLALSVANTEARWRLASGAPTEALEALAALQPRIEAGLGLHHPLAATNLLDRGRAEQALGRPDAALASTTLALALAEETEAADLQWRAHDRLARLLGEQGDRAAAIWFGKVAVERLQHLRTEVEGLDLRARQAFLRDKLDVYRHLADLLVDEGRLLEATAVLDLARGEEAAAYNRRSDGEAAPPPLSAEEEAWRARYAEIQGELVARAHELAALRGAEAGSAADARREALREDLVVMRRAWRSFVEELDETLASVSPERARELGERDLARLRSLQGTLDALGPGVVALHYLVLDDQLRILVTTAEAQVVRDVDLSRTELSRLAHALREAVSDPRRDPRPAAQQLYDHLLAPVAEDLAQAGADDLASGSATVLLSLDDVLRYVPFAALHDGERWVAQRWALALVHESARDKLREPPATGRRIGALGASQAVGTLSALPAVREELDGLVRTGDDDEDGVLPGVVLLDQDFSAASFRQVLERDFTVVHVATHFVLRPGSRQHSYLLLGDGQALDLDRLELEDFVFDDVELVTLSACQTALDLELGDGREVDGLGALLMSQGARSVLATLWPVADEGTARFMTALYAAREAHPEWTLAEAIRRTQVALATAPPSPSPGDEDTDRRSSRLGPAEGRAGTWTGPGAHPFYWAPFVLMGNWR